MTKAIFFILPFPLVAASVFSLPAQDIAALYDQVKSAVVVLKTIEAEPILDGSGKTVTTAGLGSGFLIPGEGLVMTAAHVVQTAERLQVEFVDGERIPADVIASVPDADVALLKLNWVPEGGIPAASLGDSDALRVGDRVMVIGAPYGLYHSLSVGYLSARRSQGEVNNSGRHLEFLQTDAAINHGNSGGPMFNERGEVVGIVSYILSESGGFQGLGFAASINIAKHLLLEGRQFWSGMNGKYVSGPTAEILNIPQSGGFLVQKVVLLSPAGMLGLRGGTTKAVIGDEELIVGGDIILSINDIRLVDQSKLEEARKVIADLKKGDLLQLNVLRKGAVEKLEFKLE